MSDDAMDAVARAVAQTRRLAASRLVRKEERETELARRRADRTTVGDSELAGEIDARITELVGELATVDEELKRALAELADLGKLGDQARLAGARALVASVEGDPVIRSPEEMALDNVREHLAELRGRARLSEELGEKPAPPPSSREDADAAALREFQELRAKREQGQWSGEGDPPADPPGPKKTF
jgi:hypothetical protein